MDTLDFFGVILLAVAVGAIGWVYGVGHGVNEMQKDAIKAGVAEYRIVNTNDGDSKFFFKTNTP